jgi:hypothetical protein
LSLVIGVTLTLELAKTAAMALALDNIFFVRFGKKGLVLFLK